MEENEKIINNVSWVIFIGYLVLGFVTFVLVSFTDFARDLFATTELLVLVNAVWFSAGIVSYGVYSLRKNIRRIKLTGIKQSVDSQFLIVTAFTMFSLTSVIRFILYLTPLDENVIIGLQNTAIVFEFGGFMAGLFSIYYGRQRRKVQA